MFKHWLYAVRILQRIMQNRYWKASGVKPAKQSQSFVTAVTEHLRKSFIEPANHLSSTTAAFRKLQYRVAEVRGLRGLQSEQFARNAKLNRNTQTHTETWVLYSDVSADGALIVLRKRPSAAWLGSSSLYIIFLSSSSSSSSSDLLNFGTGAARVSGGIIDDRTCGYWGLLYFSVSWDPFCSSIRALIIDLNLVDHCYYPFFLLRRRKNSRIVCLVIIASFKHKETRRGYVLIN